MKRTVFCVAAGAACAALLCALIGVCLYFPAAGGSSSRRDVALMQTGMIMMFAGAAFFALSLAGAACAALAFKFISTKK